MVDTPLIKRGLKDRRSTRHDRDRDQSRKQRDVHPPAHTRSLKRVWGPLPPPTEACMKIVRMHKHLGPDTFRIVWWKPGKKLLKPAYQPGEFKSRAAAKIGKNIHTDVLKKLAALGKPITQRMARDAKKGRIEWPEEAS